MGGEFSQKKGLYIITGQSILKNDEIKKTLISLHQHKKLQNLQNWDLILELSYMLYFSDISDSRDVQFQVICVLFKIIDNFFSKFENFTRNNIWNELLKIVQLTLGD